MPQLWIQKHLLTFLKFTVKCIIIKCLLRRTCSKEWCTFFSLKTLNPPTLCTHFLCTHFPQCVQHRWIFATFHLSCSRKLFEHCHFIYSGELATSSALFTRLYRICYNRNQLSVRNKHNIELDFSSFFLNQVWKGMKEIVDWSDPI